MLLPQTPGVNIPCCVAIDDHRIVYYELTETSFNSAAFEVCLSDLFYSIPISQKRNRILIILDNSPVYVVKVVNDFLMFSRFDGDYLPTYSPMLTPVEEAISFLKNNIREQLNSQRIYL